MITLVFSRTEFHPVSFECFWKQLCFCTGLCGVDLLCELRIDSKYIYGPCCPTAAILVGFAWKRSCSAAGACDVWAQAASRWWEGAHCRMLTAGHSCLCSLLAQGSMRNPDEMCWRTTPAVWSKAAISVLLGSVAHALLLPCRANRCLIQPKSICGFKWHSSEALVKSVSGWSVEQDLSCFECPKWESYSNS